MSDDAVYRGVQSAFWSASHVVSNEAENVAAEMMRPSVLYRPTLSVDGSMWCVLYGADLQSGVAGFGETPDDAMRAFDEAWLTQRTPDATLEGAAP